MRHSKAQSWRRRTQACLHTAALLLSGLLTAVASPVMTMAETAPLPLSAAHDPYGAFMTEASHRFGIPEKWIRAVMGFESNSNPLAVSQKGAMGLMQIMPSTWRELRVRYALGDNPIDPRANVHAGTAYLREMHERYGTVTGMLAAYNAGPDRYDDYLSRGRELPAETRAYVAALAPLLGGESLDETSPIVASKSGDWRDAPLFVAQQDAQLAAPSVQPESARHGATSAPDRRTDNAIRPPANGLFVAPSRAGGPQ